MVISGPPNTNPNKPAPEERSERQTMSDRALDIRSLGIDWSSPYYQTSVSARIASTRCIKLPFRTGLRSIMARRELTIEPTLYQTRTVT